MVLHLVFGKQDLAKHLMGALGRDIIWPCHHNGVSHCAIYVIE